MAAGTVIFSDVDGCILDAITYRPGPARAALDCLARRDIPVILCTSKTRAEVVALFEDLGKRLITIVESGGAVLVPPGTLRRRPAHGRRTRHGWLVPLAVPYPEIRAAIAELNRDLGGGIHGFGDMTVTEVAALTGLAPEDARRSRRREFDEPFIFEGDALRLRRALNAILPPRGLRCTEGARLRHLHGDTDKGRAVREVRGWLRQERGEFRTVAAGDGPHDLPMLQLADDAIIIPRPDGTANPALVRGLPGARVAPAPGPEGWTAAMGALVSG